MTDNLEGTLVPLTKFGLSYAYPDTTTSVNEIVCNDKWIFVTLSSRKYLTDFDHTYLAIKEFEI